MPTISNMKALEDCGNPPPAPPPASIPPPLRGATCQGQHPFPHPHQHRTLHSHGSQQCWNHCHYLPVAAINFPPPHPPDQVMGGRDSTPSHAGMDILPEPPSAMARGSIPAIRVDILHGQLTVPTTGSVATTSWPSNFPPPNNWYQTGQPHHQPPMVTVMTGSDEECNESSAASIKFHARDIYRESYGTSHDPTTGLENSGCNIPGKWELFQEMGLAPKPTETWKTSIALAYTY